MKNYDIETRSKQEAQRLRRGPPSIGQDLDGYETFKTQIGDDVYEFKHHRLIAVAEYGFDEVTNKSVHHKNGIEWDNRPDNLEPLTSGEHRNQHRKTSFIDDLLMLELYHNEEMTHKEVSKHFEVGRTTVRQRVGCSA